MKHILKFTITSLLVLFVLVGVAAIVVPSFVFPPEKLKPIITKFAKNYTDRELIVDGDINLSLLPNPAVKISKARLSNPEGAARKDMVTLSVLSFGLKLWPLMNGKIEVDDFILLNPEVYLEVDEANRPNWDILKAGEKAPGDISANESGDAKAQKKTDFSLKDFRIINGSISYSHAPSGKSYELSNLNMDVNIPSADEPADIEGYTTWNGQKISFSTTLNNIAKLLNGRETSLNSRIHSDVFDASFMGAMEKTDSMKLSGNLELGIESFKNFLAWSGIEAPELKGMDTLKLKSAIAYGKDEINFDNLRASNKKSTATGKLNINTSAKTPLITADIHISSLDLSHSDNKDGTDRSDPAPAPATASEQGSWSTENIDFNGLKAFDANVKAAIDNITLPGTEVKGTEINAEIKNGRLSLDLLKAELYEGKASGKLSINAQSKPPAISNKLALKNINIEKLLGDLNDFERLTGTGNLDMNVSAHGRSEKALINTLKGDGAISIENGKIKDFNLIGMINNVTSAFQVSIITEKDTDISTLNASFNIKDGVIFNDDMVLKTPFSTLKGKGEINLAQEILKYRLTPKIGVESENVAVDIKVPVIVKGSIYDPKFGPDTVGIVKEGLLLYGTGGLSAISPKGEKVEKLKEDLKEAGKDIKKKLKEDVLKNLGIQ